jgi:DNA-binding MurR/RpiR family transcriptional regulator
MNAVAPILASPPPHDFEDLRAALIERRFKLPKRLEQVARFALAYPDEIAFGTVASIAEKAGVQPSALVRFAQAVGYPGFSDLQRTVFQGHLRGRVTSYEERLAALGSAPDAANRASALFEGFCAASSASIDRLRGAPPSETLDRAARALAEAETIYLIAQRRSYPVTAYMHYAFSKLGVRTVLIGSHVGTDLETIGFAGPRDAVIAVSFTPYASATVSLAQAAAARGARMVVITDSPFSPLVTEDTLALEVVEADFRGFRSLAATLSLAMTLTVAVADGRRQDRTDE